MNNDLFYVYIVYIYILSFNAYGNICNFKMILILQSFTYIKGLFNFASKKRYSNKLYINNIYESNV